jgi:two-component system sensor histidine kinase KdpD
LTDLVTQAARNAHPQPGKRLHVDLPPNLPPLAVDRRRITAVLRNQIENAAKYGGEEGPICVTAVAENGNVIIRISDEGPGIPAAYGEQIFSSFYRVENGLTRQTAGAGLGLAISRGFVRAHGGDIWLESPARGACIAFSLPLTEPEAL